MNAVHPKSPPAAGGQPLAFMAWLLLACLLVFPAGTQSAAVEPWQAIQADHAVQALEGLPRHEGLLRPVQRPPEPEDDPEVLLARAFQHTALALAAALPRYPHLGLSPARFRPAPQSPRAPPLSA